MAVDPWIDPAVTRAILNQWQADGCPAELWPITLYPDGDEERAVLVGSAAELVELTRDVVETRTELNE